MRSVYNLMSGIKTNTVSFTGVITQDRTQPRSMDDRAESERRFTFSEGAEKEYSGLSMHMKMRVSQAMDFLFQNPDLDDMEDNELFNGWDNLGFQTQIFDSLSITFSRRSDGTIHVVYLNTFSPPPPPPTGGGVRCIPASKTEYSFVDAVSRALMTSDRRKRPLSEERTAPEVWMTPGIIDSADNLAVTCASIEEIETYYATLSSTFSLVVSAGMASSRWFLLFVVESVLLPAHAETCATTGLGRRRYNDGRGEPPAVRDDVAALFDGLARSTLLVDSDGGGIAGACLQDAGGELSSTGILDIDLVGEETGSSIGNRHGRDRKTPGSRWLWMMLCPNVGSPGVYHGALRPKRYGIGWADRGEVLPAYGSRALFLSSNGPQLTLIWDLSVFS